MLHTVLRVDLGERGGAVAGVISRLVREIKRGVRQRPHRPDSRARVLCGYQAVEQALRHRLAGLVVAGEPAQDGRLPTPVLKHLRRRLHEVVVRRGAGVPQVLGPGERRVQHVPELVEEHDEFIFAQSGS